MPADRLIIEEMILRLPGLTAEEARAVSRDVAERVGRGLAEAMPKRSLGALEIRLTARPGASRDELASRVADAIVRSLLR